MLMLNVIQRKVIRMIDVMQDVEVLENALIALNEGASDEKRSAIYSLESMLQRKMVEVAEYEEWIEEQAAMQSWMEGNQI